MADRPLRQADYRLEKMDDELLLFHPAQTKILYCNETASLIWQLCNGEHTTQEIVEMLSTAYPEAAKAIPGDVAATLSRFFEHGAIQYV